MKLEEIKSGALIKGIDNAEPVHIISTEIVGPDAITV